MGSAMLVALSSFYEAGMSIMMHTAVKHSTAMGRKFNDYSQSLRVPPYKSLSLMAFAPDNLPTDKPSTLSDPQT
jgi:hypothetical protein